MSKRLTAMLAGVTALALTVGGCGSGGDSTASTKTGAEAPLTKAAYVKKGNAICRRLNEDTAKSYEALFRGKQKPSDAQMRAAGAKIYLPNLEARLAALRKLPAPAGQAGEVEGMLNALQAGINKVIIEGTIPFNGTAATFTEANQLAKEFGLIFCIAS